MNTAIESIPTVADNSVTVALDASIYAGKIGGKKEFVTLARAAGMSRSEAEAAFDLALAGHRQALTARAGALLGAGFVALSEKMTKTGLIKYTFADGKTLAKKAEDKTAARIAKLEAQLAQLRGA